MNVIGIRSEDKSHWEARVPVVPRDVRKLIEEQGLRFGVETSPNRAFTDDDYREAGATVLSSLAECPIILGVKEIPPEKLEPGKTYVYFSHTIKGQAANLPALRRLMDLGCQLIDYERIVDREGRRLVFFGKFAGLAGMIDTLWALGQRLVYEGTDSPFSGIGPAHRYRNLDHAKREIARVGEIIRQEGLPEAVTPLVCGFAGYGQVSQGAQEIFDLLPVQEVLPAELPSTPRSSDVCYKVVFAEEHLVDRIDGSSPFDLQEYYDCPERYQAAFFSHLPYLTMLVNCIYWEPRYPRLITRDQFRELYAQPGGARLRVIGDVTCDIDGSVECTVRATAPDNPVYVYDPFTARTQDGVAGSGPVVLAVDFLPCELPIDASEFFSAALAPFMPDLAGADLQADLEETGLPPELQRAAIVHRGQLTEPYRYLEEHLT